MEQGKTIKQIADELKVSKTAVYKKIDNLGLRLSLRKIANQFTVDKKQENLIKQAFIENQSQTKNVNHVYEIDNQSQTSLQLISMLQKELDIKNKQIEELNLRLAEAHKMAEQAQQLHGADKALELKEAQEPKIEEKKTKKRWQFWK